MTIFIVIMIANIPAGNYMFKVNNRNTRASCEIFSKLTRTTFAFIYLIQIVGDKSICVFLLQR